MKITVIGATRGIGLALVKLALEQGHEVKALVRSASALAVQHPKLEVVVGSILDHAAVEVAVQGQDLVCTCIGVKPSRQPIFTFSQGASAVLAALQKHPSVRWMAITGIGAGDSRGHGGFLYDRIILPLLLASMYADKDREEALIRASNVDWTIVRPAMLTNGKRTGHYRTSVNLTGVVAGKIPRSDVADFVLKEAQARQFVRQTLLLG